MLCRGRAGSRSQAQLSSASNVQMTQLLMAPSPGSVCELKAKKASLRIPKRAVGRMRPTEDAALADYIADLPGTHTPKEAKEESEVAAATRIAVLEAELSQTKHDLAAAQHQANLVPQLLAIMGQLAQQQFAAAGEGFPEHLASLTPAQQAVLAAASHLLHADSFSPSQSFEVGDQLVHTYSMPYAAQDTSAGSVLPEHAALQQAVEDLSAAIAAGYTAPADTSRKRKAEGSFGRGAPGQKRFCPLCKNADGTPTPLAGNHNAICPWCKKCWSKKQRVLKADCTIHSHSMDGSLSTHPSMLHMGSDTHEPQEHDPYPHHHNPQQQDPHELHHSQLPVPHMGQYPHHHDPHASHLDHLHGDPHAAPHTFHEPSHHALHHAAHYHAGLHDAEVSYHDLGHHHALHDPSLMHEAALHAAHHLHGLAD